jgi:HD-GYP domain-containing protein (c-di-GMP phosphodiesterase class II)
LLHDVGKLAVSEKILQKTDKLTPAEWTEVKAHPVVGCELILAISPRLDPIAMAIRSHHERWDGSGYPDRLEGDDIPILGRIIALADVYDALTKDRPYRQSAFSVTDAQQMIEQSSGSHFDPMLVPLFLDTVCHKRSRKRHPTPAR